MTKTFTQELKELLKGQHGCLGQCSKWIEQTVLELIGSDEPEHPYVKPKRGRPRKYPQVTIQTTYLSAVIRNQLRAELRSKVKSTVVLDKDS
jgi:hypothetical protein